MPRPLEPVSSALRIGLGTLFFVLFVAGWAWATFGGYVTRTFLADPLTMVREGWELLVRHGFLYDIGITVWRVVGGFALAALLAGSGLWFVRRATARRKEAVAVRADTARDEDRP